MSVVALCSPAPAGAESALEVSTDFVSSSVQVESIDQESRVIRIRPPVHSGRGWQCWWYFKVTGITPGEVITIDLGGGEFAQPARATFSTDQADWCHTAPGEQRNGRIVYQQQIEGREAWFAWGPPFTGEDASKLVKSVAGESPYAEAFTLCHSREGRPVPALRVQQPGVKGAKRYSIWISARQHAWESGSSWVCRGLIEWLVSENPRAEALRKRAMILVVPVMDVDNVALGAGGKEQKPRDHNRDWIAEPYHPAVAAAQREIKRLDGVGRFALYLDLHNPTPWDKASYCYLPPRAIYSDEGWANLQRFLMTAQAELTEPLAFRGRTVGSGESGPLSKQTGAIWTAQNTAPHVVSLTLEIPWNTPFSTTEGYRTVGRKVGLAIDRYFNELPEQQTDGNRLPGDR